MKNNNPNTKNEILKAATEQFRDRFGVNIWRFEKIPNDVGQYVSCNMEIEDFWISKLQEIERAAKIEALEWLQENASGAGDWRRKIIMKVAQLKGEDK